MAYVHDPADITPAMTSDTSPSPYVVEYSSIITTGYEGWQAFEHLNSKDSHCWASAVETNPWISFDFGAEVLVNGYMLATYFYYYETFSPTAWYFQGSQNGTDWTTLDDQTSQTLPSNGELSAKYLITPSTYRYFRIYITAQGASGRSVLGEVELFRPNILTAESGSYALTGQAAALGASRKLQALGDSYALTGQAAALRASRKLQALGDSYALTGQEAIFRGGRLIAAEGGSYVFTGQAAALRASRKLQALGDSYALTGQDAILRLGKLIAAEGGSYVFTGQVVDLELSRKIAAGPGSYILTGQEVSLLYSGGWKNVIITGIDAIRGTFVYIVGKMKQS